MQNPNPYTKKEACKAIENSLASLELLKAFLGKKKCNKRIKKAARLLTSGLPKNNKPLKKEQVPQPSVLPVQHHPLA